MAKVKIPKRVYNRYAEGFFKSLEAALIDSATPELEKAILRTICAELIPIAHLLEQARNAHGEEQ